ncbi:Replication factor C [Tubulinosema ratisbonensis]|uniref:Replication factor C n=1 Tax=Tubulinosema ratisbonensis TaxID=291195 RepID=A0A437AKD6_9MICR|nr:Replication factor C [Tubulinosema ratisbonensis]
MQLLVDKYRPKDFSNVLGNKDAIQALSTILLTKNMPHMLFTGPPGTGKTTSARIIAANLACKQDILELNASDERGIEVVRSTIKHFAQKTSESPFKIIILDEADSMTTTAQQGLRRIMELYANNTRFILICNTFTKIFEPIQSRCAVIKFDKLTKEELHSQIKSICEKEGMNINDSAVNTIITLSDGDMRQSLNILQSLIGLTQITEEKVSKITGNPSPKKITELVDELLKNNLEKVFLIFDSIWEEKYDPVDIISAFFREAKNRNDYELMKSVGVTQLRISEGINSKLQFYKLFYEISKNK